MPGLSGAQIIDIWDLGRQRNSIERSLVALALAYPERSWGEMESLPIGQRDALLMRLYAATFGTAVQACHRCPACDEKAEVDLVLAEFLALDVPPVEPLEFRYDGCDVSFRLPDSRDLTGILGMGSEADARRLLASECVTEIRGSDSVVEKSLLDESFIASLSSRIAECDALAEIEIELKCPECAHVWSAFFDISSFFWSRIESSARRLMSDVATLASRFGWSEQAILEMSPHRRETYLNLSMV